MNQFERAMVVVAHPDDAEFGCSGTVALWCASGVDVTYILCTDGSKGSGDPAMTSDRLALIRRREQQTAALVLGVKQVVFLDYPDSYLLPSLELRRDIAREIRRYRPQKLICQNPVRTLSTGRGGGHPDHIAAGEATLAAVFPAARDRLTFPELLEEGLEPYRVEEVLIFGTDAPDWWIDVSSSIAKVVEAIKEHKSQIGDRLQKLDQRMRESRHTVGEQHGMEFGEAFKRLVYN